MVLTETDFLNRLSFDSPLDIKFRADALGRTILFIGYSMSDPNIRLLLHRIWQIWEESGHKDDRPRSFVFMPTQNPVQEALLARWGDHGIDAGEGCGSAAPVSASRVLRQTWASIKQKGSIPAD